MNTTPEPVPVTPRSAPLLPESRPINTLSPADAPDALATLTLAFAADPAVRWLFPDAAGYLTGFPLFARAFGGGAFAAATATSIEQGRAVALWLPPGMGPNDEALVKAVKQFAPTSRCVEALELFGQMGQLHPIESHWYLPLIGAEPTVQGRGLGSMLLAHTLSQCDALGLPAYLEATSNRNLPLYRRHGFEVIEMLRVGTCPPITAMLRRPAK